MNRVLMVAAVLILILIAVFTGFAAADYNRESETSEPELVSRYKLMFGLCIAVSVISGLLALGILVYLGWNWRLHSAIALNAEAITSSIASQEATRLTETGFSLCETLCGPRPRVAPSVQVNTPASA